MHLYLMKYHIQSFMDLEKNKADFTLVSPPFKQHLLVSQGGFALAVRIRKDLHAKHQPGQSKFIEL